MGLNPKRAMHDISMVSLILCFIIILAKPHTSHAQNTQQEYLDAHNMARSEVGVGGLVWDDTVAAYALNYANQRAGDCAMMHSNGPYGENLFSGYGKEWTATDAVNSWVSEKAYYDHASNSCAQDQVCGHYTQVVWRNSVSLGCARVQCSNGWWFITCNYNPPGNVNGQSPY
ncbi:pathogenesis-related protein 1B-like [Diospyros lotus]|uniref:pathogenesis-related protein 1B-like n=1 Tax=Diospyros lotus TaxID=55363 RepID=UPI0022558B5A|nr:pathogenesis-related protein 1B-like [Diospyros lotus]